MEAREKELIAVATSIAAGCEYCTAFHVKTARTLGIGEADLEAFAALGMEVRRRATGRMGEVAGRELRGGVPEECAKPAPLGRLEALAGAASALALNFGAGIGPFVDSAAAAGADENQVEVTLALARKIKKVAAEKAEEEFAKSRTEQGCGCRSSCESQNPCAEATR